MSLLTSAQIVARFAAIERDILDLKAIVAKRAELVTPPAKSAKPAPLDIIDDQPTKPAKRKRR